MNCCLIASCYIIVEIVFFAKICFTESIQNCFIWTVLWFCSWLYNIWVDISGVKERGYEISDPYKHCVGQSLGSWNDHNLWVIAERPIDFRTLVLFWFIMHIDLDNENSFFKRQLTPIWGIWGTELASFLDKKSRVTFSVLMTSYLTENFLFHNNFKLR